MGSKRNMVLIGFALSLISVTFNSIVIGYVNGRLKTVDDERAKLTVLLERQASAQSDGEAQFAIYRVLHNVGFAVHDRERDGAEEDAITQLGNALTKWYQAAYDVPQVEMEKAQVEEYVRHVPIMEQGAQLAREWESAKSAKERERIEKQLDAVNKQLPEPTSDLERKVRELQDTAEKIERAGDNGREPYSEIAAFSALLPIESSFKVQAAENSSKKRARIHQLEDERASLVTKLNYSSYGAVAFQLFGLMFILARDLWSHKKASAQ